MTVDRPVETRMTDVDYSKLADFRRHTVINRVAKKTSPAEDLLILLDSPVGRTVDRLLDALAALVVSTSAGKAKTLHEIRTSSKEPPLPSFQSAWADMVQTQADNRLWELTEEVNAWLNLPTDPKNWGDVCDVCGRKRIGDATYCQRCGSRILAGARRCRLTGCPNEGKRRALCPKRVWLLLPEFPEWVQPIQFEDGDYEWEILVEHGDG